MPKKKPVQPVQNFAYTPSTPDVPALTALPTTWDVAAHYYQSIDDPQIETDVRAAEQAYTGFAKHYKDSDFASNPTTLAQALTDLNTLSEKSALGKPIRYLSFLSTLDTTNETILKRLNLLSERLTKASNNLLFFGLELAATPKGSQRQLLRASELQPWKYELQQRFLNAKYHLSEPEEKIIRRLRNVSSDMWVDATEKMLGARTVTYQNEELPLNSAFDHVSKLQFEDQPVLWAAIMERVAELAEFVEHELTAVAARKKTMDELRGYKQPYSASIIDHDDDEKSVQALIEAVSTKGFALSKKFYKLKAALHGVDQLQYAQRSASVGEPLHMPFTQANEIARDVFYGVDRTYGEIFDRLLLGGQIDVYPQQGKRGGAFCASDTGMRTYVMLNQADTMRSLETYAHEMGHAIHSERSKTQPAHYQDYSTTTAETASTLFEGLLFDAIQAQTTPDQRAVLLHDKLSGDIATIQRQIAFYNFELEMHETVRAQGAISRHELNEMMQKHLRSYCGAGVHITEQDGHSYIYVAHLRYGFYVYTYAFGHLMSSVMIDNLKADPGYVSRIDAFLTAGGSDSVANIFKRAQINTKQISTFEAGLERMDAEIRELKKLTK